MRKINTENNLRKYVAGRAASDPKVPDIFLEIFPTPKNVQNKKCGL